jgi:hypothetical protein
VKKNTIIRQKFAPRINLHAPIIELLIKLKNQGLVKRSSKGEFFPIGKSICIPLTHPQILNYYNSKIRGILNYYSCVHNRNELWLIVRFLRYSCALTLARKFKLKSLKKTFHKFGKDLTFVNEKGKKYTIFQPDNLRMLPMDKRFNIKMNENIDEQRVSDLANRFYEAKYDIPTLLREIFQSDWFYDEKNVGSLIKSPIELIVGLNRTFGISYTNSQPLLAVQRVLGQTLFFPPNVAGWAGGRNWIDNSTLLTRLSLPKKLAEADQLDYVVKNNMDDENPNESLKPNPKYRLECNMNWELFSKKFESIPQDEQWQALQQHLLAVKNPLKMSEKLSQRLEGKSQAERIKTMSIYITRTPEYQLA